MNTKKNFQKNIITTQNKVVSLLSLSIDVSISAVWWVIFVYFYPFIKYRTAQKAQKLYWLSKLNIFL